MLMTTAEASSVWCPMSRVIFQEPNGTVPSNQATFNRLAVNDPNAPTLTPGASMCCANQCAMWRWADGPCGGARRGYCGLAGSPVAT
jgi:hypothetical protein